MKGHLGDGVFCLSLGVQLQSRLARALFNIPQQFSNTMKLMVISKHSERNNVNTSELYFSQIVLTTDTLTVLKFIYPSLEDIIVK